MASLAPLVTRLLSDKGMAQPMLAQGTAYRGAARESVMWHPAATRRLALKPSFAVWAGPAKRTTQIGRESGARVRASLRLRHDLHQRLKTHAAVDERTQQSVLLQALEEYLDRQDEHRTIDGDRRRPMPG